MSEPVIPAEVWMLWDTPSEEAYKPGWVRALDGVPDDLYLACTSEAEAIDAAKHQNEQYECNCVPVRVR